MVETVEIESLRPALAELERAVKWAYSLTGDRLEGPPVTVSIATKGRKVRCLGWFIPQKWETREGQPSHELQVSAEDLHRDPVDIIATVVHETVHLFCNDADIKDTAKNGRHNKKFREEAENFGLVCEDPTDSYGYGYTSPGEDLQTAIEKDFKPDYAAFNLARLVAPKKEKGPPKTKSYECQCLSVRVANGKEFNATCNVCEEPYQEKEAA